MNGTNALKLTKNEELKQADPLLAGNIALTLADPAAECFSHEDYEFLKFHGIYQQDDRDRRKQGKHYIFMVRTKFPGGTLTSEQYLACDRLAETFGNQTLRITTRQCFQFHGVIKSGLRETIRQLNEAMVTTLGACGDVVRNTLAPPTPATSPVAEQLIAAAHQLSRELLPRTPAYHQIWVEGQELKPDPATQSGFRDPLYERRYLPRKFKIAFALPPRNDTDVFTNDLGFVAIAEGDHLLGFNLLAGGGLGRSHGNAETYPRLADVMGFIRPDQLVEAAKAVVGIHRDFGDRTNRKHARLKYVIAERGVEWFRGELQTRLGEPLAPPRPFEFTEQGDWLGWHPQTDGRWFLGLFVENGRIRDAEGLQLKTALQRVLEEFRPELRLTPSQNILLVNVPAESRAALDAVLAEYGVRPHDAYSPARLRSMACPALPTCGLALAESERALPGFMTRIEALLTDLGLANEPIIVRMTGCPNGCARPYMAEIGLVGKAPDKYQIYLGGNEAGTRLNWLYRDTVRTEELIAELRPVLARFARERQPGERFGDWCERALRPELPGPAGAAAVSAGT